MISRLVAQPRSCDKPRSLGLLEAQAGGSGEKRVPDPACGKVLPERGPSYHHIPFSDWAVDGSLGNWRDSGAAGQLRRLLGS
jgi:hypothetical protein